MSDENVEMVRRAFEAYERGDLDAAVVDIAPDCEYVAAGTVPGRTGTYRGPEGYKSLMAWLDEEFSDSRAQVDALIDAGDSVVVGATLRGQGRQSGISYVIPFDGVITSWTWRAGATPVTGLKRSKLDPADACGGGQQHRAAGPSNGR